MRTPRQPLTPHEPAGRRHRSVTRAFGVTTREGHDSSPFYQRHLYQDLTLASVPAPRSPTASASAEPGSPAAAAPIQPPLPAGSASEAGVSQPWIDQLYCADSRHLAAIPDESVHLMVTSPPYNVGKEYDEDLSLSAYRQLLRDVFREVYRVLVNGGRAAINVANLGRKPYVPLHAFIISDMLELGYQMRGEIIWDKSASAGVSCAWGSWRSASNPTLRDVHEYILVFTKGQWGRPKSGHQSTLSQEEFVAYTKSVWRFPTESARHVGHPAPFPVELPRRLIQLYTFTGDVVLDPFCGSGTTCVAAVLTGRHYVGYDIAPEYIDLARRRLQATPLPLSPAPASDSAPLDGGPGADKDERADRTGE